MISSEKIEAKLISDEGLKLFPYWDTATPPRLTIGIGRNLTDSGISKEEAIYLLRNDIYAKTAECDRRFPWFVALDDARQGVIVCMAFQLGTNGVANFKKMIYAIEDRDYAEAAAQMLDSNWRKQTPERCERMARVMKTGVWE